MRGQSGRISYTRSDLDGEAREGAFHGPLLATLAAVNLQVQAANLAVQTAGFIATGLVIKHLLMFYPDRAEARRAAAKFTFVRGAGDVTLILAAALLWPAFGTTEIKALTQAAGAHLPAPPTPGPLEGALIVLALASLGLVAVASRSKTGRGLTTVPIFLSVPQVRLPSGWT